MELSGMLAVARSVSVSSTREPQCGTATQNQPSVICRDNGACHPHHRVAEHTTDVISLPIKTEQTPVSF